MASTQQKQELENNIGKTAPKTKLILTGLTRKEDQNGRKTLQTLQFSALNENKNHVTKEKKPHIQSCGFNKQPIAVFRDPETSNNVLHRSFDNKAVQTEEIKKQRKYSSLSDEEIDEEAYDLMINEEIPETYWKQLAEERRLALNDSLHENESLHKEVNELKEENAKLSQLASQAEYFATVIKDIMGDENEEKSNDISSENNEEQISEKCTEKTDQNSEKEDIVKNDVECKRDDSDHSDNDVDNENKSETDVDPEEKKSTPTV